ASPRSVVDHRGGGARVATYVVASEEHLQGLTELPRVLEIDPSGAARREPVLGEPRAERGRRRPPLPTVLVVDGVDEELDEPQRPLGSPRQVVARHPATLAFPCYWCRDEGSNTDEGIGAMLSPCRQAELLVRPERGVE